jgi:hypothetical protein
MTIEKVVEAHLPGTAFALAASAARTADGNGTAVTGLGGFRRFMVLLEISASATDAADTLDVFVDVSPDGGTTWINAIHFAQQAGDGSAKDEIAVLEPSTPGVDVVAVTSDAATGKVRPGMFGDQMRARWEVADSGDANSSHTFSVKLFAQ